MEQALLDLLQAFGVVAFGAEECRTLFPKQATGRSRKHCPASGYMTDKYEKELKTIWVSIRTLAGKYDSQEQAETALETVKRVLQKDPFLARFFPSSAITCNIGWGLHPR